MGKLPHGQIVAEKVWPVLSASSTPTIDLKSYKLRVFGEVEEELSFSWDDLMKIPKVKVVLDMHCLVPGSMVYADPEPLEIQDVKVGSRIIGADGLKHTVTKLVKRTHSGKIIGVKASHLPSVLMTPDHPVLAIKAHPGYGKSKSKRRQKTFARGYERGWIRAEELDVGDYVFFPRYNYLSKKKFVNFGEYKLPVDERLAYVLGWYVAEGSSNSDRKRIKRNATFSLNHTEIRQADKLRKLVEELFGAKTSVYGNRNHTLLNVRITSAKIDVAPMFRYWCGTNALTKKIPDFIIDSDKATLKTFLLAFFEGDGYSPLYTGMFNRRNNFIDFTTSSKILAYQLILALSKLSIPSYLVNHPGSVRMGYSVRVHGNVAKLLLSDFPVFNIINRNRYWEADEGFYYPIRRIWTEEYNGPVYDFKAPTSPDFSMLSPFVTQDCVTHWSRLGDEWEGIPIKYFLDLAKPKGEFLMLRSSYVGYSANVPLSYIDDNCMVAFGWNGKPIEPKHGGPVRAFVPTLYAWKSTKWLDGIEVMKEDMPGYWEKRGYNMRGDYWKEERYWKGLNFVNKLDFWNKNDD